MCSYNRLNGSYASNNEWLQKNVLKKHWSFPGLVMSDWGASHNVTDVAKGLDLEMPSGANLNWTKIQAAMTEGTVKEADIDDAVHRFLRTAFAMHWLDADWKQKNATLPLDSPDSAQVALDVARASIVLLKNDKSALPLDRSQNQEHHRPRPQRHRRQRSRLRRSRPWRSRRRHRRRSRWSWRWGAGGGQTPANIGGGGSGAVVPFPTHAANADYFQGIKKAAGDGVTVTYLPVTPAANPGDPPTMPDAAQLKSADAVIVCVGLNRNSETEGRDRAFELPQLQQDLIKLAAANNPRTIVINNSGAAVGMTTWIDQTPAVLQAWYLGQEGGIAVGEVLFGAVNPSGHLVSTFDRAFEENPAFKNYPGTSTPGLNYPTLKYEEGLFYGYRGYDQAQKAPLFPFGHGLTYTTFSLSNPATTTLVGTSSLPRRAFVVTLDVKNTGTRAGSQILQLYVGEPNCPVPRPQRELKAFQKVTLAPGASQQVTFTLTDDAFAYWHPQTKAWTVTPAASFNIEVGSSQRDLPIKQTVTLEPLIMR